MFRWPASRADFWHAKISRNVERDHRVRVDLLGSGWRVGEVWECALRGPGRWPAADVLDRCVAFLDGPEAEMAVSSLGDGDRSRAV
jgi:DNA mismatch endonuclease (patch repair protein)